MSTAEPRVRPGLGLLLLGCMGGSFAAARTETALGCLAISLAAAWLAGAPRPKRGWFLSLAVASAVATVLNAYLIEGPALPAPRVFGHPATAEGIRHGMLLALRLVGAAVALQAIAAAWPGERAADEIARLLAPLERVGLPVRDLRSVVALALRLGPLLPSEVGRIRRLQEHRAGRRGTSIGGRLDDLRAVLVPAMVSTLERAERMAMALEARHYSARLPAATPGHRSLYALGGLCVFATAIAWRG